MQGTLYSIVVNILAIITGLTLFAASITGFFRTRLPLLMRFILGPVGLSLALYNNVAAEFRTVIAIGIMGLLFLTPKLLGMKADRTTVKVEKKDEETDYNKRLHQTT